METNLDSKISQDLIYAIAIVAFVGLFVFVNYFFGFNLPLYVIAMAIGTVLAIIYPRAGLYATIFLTFIFERFFTLAPIVLGRVEYKLYPIDMLIGAIVLGTLWQILSGRITPKFRKIDIVLIVFLILSILYFFVSVFVLKSNMALAFSAAKNYGFYALLFFATFILINSEEYLKELALVIFAGAAGILWFIFYGIMVGKGLWSDFTPLSTEGVRTLAFTHAFYLCIALIIAFVYMAYKSDRISRYLLVLAPIWAIGIVGSMMRHLWISLFCTLVFLIVMFTNRERKRLKKYTVAYAFMAICTAVVIFYGLTMFPRSGAYETFGNSIGIIQSRFVSIANTGGDESIVWRSAVWQQATKQYLHSPIFGIGFGKLIPVEIGKYHDFVEARDVHNSFLVLLIQMGIVGFGLIAFLVLKLGWNGLKIKFENETLQMAAYATTGILVLQIVAFMFQPYLEANLLGIFFWINLGVLRTLITNNRQLTTKN